MNNKRKSLLIVISMMLVCALSIAGTMAYLTKTTDTVSNTFTAGKLFDEKVTGYGITLTESAVKQDTNGDYIKDESKTTRVTSNKYEAVIPGSTIFKDPQVDIKGLATESYLYIVVKDNTIDFDYSIDGSKWKDTGLKLSNNIVYVYSNGESEAAKVKGGLSAVGIIENNKITAKSTLSDSIGNIEFKAYLVQTVGFKDANAAWNATFGATPK